MKRVMLIAILAMGLFMGVANAAERNCWFNEDSSFSNMRAGNVLNGTALVGIDIMTPEATGEHFSYGLGVEYTGYILPTEANQIFGSSYNLDTEFKIGANIKAASKILPFPLKIKVGFGYGVTRMGSFNSWDFTNSIEVETNIYKKVGLGVGYKNSSYEKTFSIYLTYKI